MATVLPLRRPRGGALPSKGRGLRPSLVLAIATIAVAVCFAVYSGPERRLVGKESSNNKVIKIPKNTPQAFKNLVKLSKEMAVARQDVFKGLKRITDIHVKLHKLIVEEIKNVKDDEASEQTMDVDQPGGATKRGAADEGPSKKKMKAEDEDDDEDDDDDDDDDDEDGDAGDEDDDEDGDDGDDGDGEAEESGEDGDDGDAEEEGEDGDSSEGEDGDEADDDDDGEGEDGEGEDGDDDDGEDDDDEEEEEAPPAKSKGKSKPKPKPKPKGKPKPKPSPRAKSAASTRSRKPRR